MRLIASKNKLELSEAGKLLVNIINRIETLVPEIVHEIDPEYDSKNTYEKEQVDKRAEIIITIIMTKLMD